MANSRFWDRSQRLEQLALARRETVEETKARLPARLLVVVPFVKENALRCRKLEIETAGVEDGLPFIRLVGGRIFYGHPAQRRDRLIFALLEGRLPPAVTAETYRLAHDVASRYHRVKAQRLPRASRVIVEAGAYVGIKAIRYADHVGRDGKVLAIEMMPSNYELMCKNITANGLDDVVTPINCGLWSEAGTLTAAGKGLQQNSLVTLDEFRFKNKVEVATRPLDDIIDEHGLEHVDFLNMQINGAEIEAVRGLRRRIGSILMLRIAAYYSRDGRSNADVCCELLREMGCECTRNEKGGIKAFPQGRERVG